MPENSARRFRTRAKDMGPPSTGADEKATLRGFLGENAGDWGATFRPSAEDTVGGVPFTVPGAEAEPRSGNPHLAPC